MALSLAGVRDLVGAVFGNTGSFFPAERSCQLLRANLSAAQRKDYDKSQSFTVIGGVTGTTYLIKFGWQMNIFVLKLGDMSNVYHEIDNCSRLCVGPVGVPVGDVMLAQKIMLECDEVTALRIATSIPYRR